MNELRELCVRKLSGPKQDMQRSNAMWDRRAGEFRRMIEAEEQGALSPAVRLLREHADEGSTVLDVGCGVGRHLVQMLRAGLRPEGLEPSAEMRRQARDYLACAGFSPDRVTLHGEAFQDFAPAHRYDYIFLSNSPALSDYDNYSRLLALAEKGLMIQSWLAMKEDVLEKTEKLLGRKAHSHGGPDLIYFMNLLLSDGYYPEFRAVTREEERRVAPETLCHRYASWFFGQSYSEAELHRVQSALDSLREADGTITARRKDTMGMLFLSLRD